MPLCLTTKKMFVKLNKLRFTMVDAALAELTIARADCKYGNHHSN